MVDVHPSLRATFFAGVATTCANASISLVQRLRGAIERFVSGQDFLSAVQVVDFVSIRKLECSQQQVCDKLGSPFLRPTPSPYLVLTIRSRPQLTFPYCCLVVNITHSRPNCTRLYTIRPSEREHTGTFHSSPRSPNPWATHPNDSRLHQIPQLHGEQLLSIFRTASRLEVDSIEQRLHTPLQRGGKGGIAKRAGGGRGQSKSTRIGCKHLNQEWCA